MWEGLIAKLVPLIINTISPELKRLLCDFCSSLEAKARTTSNPWDDILAQVLKGILCPK